MKLWILSKRKIEAIENALSEHVADDLFFALSDEDSLVLSCSAEIVSQVAKENPQHKFHYEITINKQ